MEAFLGMASILSISGLLLIFFVIRYYERKLNIRKKEIETNILFYKIEEFIKLNGDEYDIWNTDFDKSCITTSNLKIYINHSKNYFEFNENKDCFSIIEYDHNDGSQSKFVLNKDVQCILL